MILFRAVVTGVLVAMAVRLLDWLTTPAQRTDPKEVSELTELREYTAGEDPDDVDRSGFADAEDDNPGLHMGEEVIPDGVPAGDEPDPAPH